MILCHFQAFKNISVWCGFLWHSPLFSLPWRVSSMHRMKLFGSSYCHKKPAQALQLLAHLLQKLPWTCFCLVSQQELFIQSSNLCPLCLLRLGSSRAGFLPDLRRIPSPRQLRPRERLHHHLELFLSFHLIDLLFQFHLLARKLHTKLLTIFSFQFGVHFMFGDFLCFFL